MNFKDNNTKTALEAKEYAQFIAFSPVIFQVAKCMRDFGIFELLHENKNGLSQDELSKKIDLSSYAIQVLLESSLSADFVYIENEKYKLSKTGYYLLKDSMTRINFDYINEVNYQGLFYLDESLKEGKAVGLKHVFNGDDTIYPLLSTLPSKAKKAWFGFDHFYSDTAFDEVIKRLLDLNPSKVLDIGGNTGKFILRLAKENENIKLGVVDLKEQILTCKQNVQENGFLDRVEFHPMNILDDDSILPSGFDTILMSQFLDCFCEEDIIKILSKVAKISSNDTKIIILEPLWDKQKFQSSSFCIINTSPYFSALANGKSKMFNYKDLSKYIEKAGLKIAKEVDNIGICQSMLVCQKA